MVSCSPGSPCLLNSSKLLYSSLGLMAFLLTLLHILSLGALNFSKASITTNIFKTHLYLLPRSLFQTSDLSANYLLYISICTWHRQLISTFPKLNYSVVDDNFLDKMLIISLFSSLQCINWLSDIFFHEVSWFQVANVNCYSPNCYFFFSSPSLIFFKLK